MVQIKQNIPKLRFKEFSGEWKEKKLGEVSTFLKGKGISKADISDEGKIECIRYGELYTKYGETIKYVDSRTKLEKNGLIFSKKNDVIIPASGETQIDIATASCVLNEGIALGGDLNIIRTSNNGVFLSYYLNNKKKIDIAKLSQGISVVHLYSSQLKTLNINLPFLQEQEKIASFLSSVEEKIEKIKEKKKLLEDYKKGVMQKIFNQEIRFKDENGKEFGEWEEKNFGNISNIKRGASPRPITDKIWFDDNSNIGWVRISDVTKSNKYLNKTEQYLSKEGISKSRLIKEGNIIMSICATIGKPIYTNFDVCIHDGFIVFDNLKSNKEYIYYYLEYIEKNWYKYGQPGSQINLNSDIVSNELIYLPISLKEQEKIAYFLSGIDEKINKISEELEKVEEFKKGLLQDMFI